MEPQRASVPPPDLREPREVSPGPAAPTRWAALTQDRTHLFGVPWAEGPERLGEDPAPRPGLVPRTHRAGGTWQTRDPPCLCGQESDALGSQMRLDSSVTLCPGTVGPQPGPLPGGPGPVDADRRAGRRLWKCCEQLNTNVLSAKLSSARTRGCARTPRGSESLRVPEGSTTPLPAVSPHPTTHPPLAAGMRGRCGAPAAGGLWSQPRVQATWSTPASFSFGFLGEKAAAANGSGFGAGSPSEEGCSAVLFLGQPRLVGSAASQPRRRV